MSYTDEVEKGVIVPIVCWGPHVKLAPYCLQSLNLEGHRVIVYTDQPENFLSYDVRPIPQGRDKHQRTTAAFRDALQYGPICTIAPDMVASLGLLEALEKHLDKNLVMVPVVRIEQCLPFYDPPAQPFYARELASYAIHHQHERQKLQFLDKIPCLSNPTNVFQRKGNTLTVRCFHMHPILINTDRLDLISPPIDDFMVTKFPKEKIHIVTDSDEMMVVDQTPSDYNWNGTRMTEPVKTDEFIYRKCNYRHRWFFEHECYIHDGPIEKPDPDPRMDAILKLSREIPQRWTE